MANPIGSGYAGQIGISSATSDFNKHYFLVQQALGKVRTMQIVQVVGTYSSGQIAAAGLINVTLLVNQVDGLGNATPHGTIYQIPYLRMQGGSNAIIMDPQVGDIGWCGFADRDISSVIRAKKQANPGSRRKFDISDGVYIGGMLNAVPTQYMAFSSTGISITSPTVITMTAPTITLDATTKVELNTPDTQIDGNLTSGAGSGSTASFNGSLTATGQVTGNGIPLSTHIHTGVQSGSSDTGGPIV